MSCMKRGPIGRSRRQNVGTIHNKPWNSGISKVYISVRPQDWRFVVPRAVVEKGD